MEYHAIEDKQSFGELKEILARKAKEGVEVRLFYDDIGSIGFINTDFIQRMEAEGIQCRVFNRLMPVLNVFMNNRDHRKITVIDGKSVLRADIIWRTNILTSRIHMVTGRIPASGWKGMQCAA